jgi:hypothetical protein
MFDRSGNVMQFLSKPGTPKFAVSNRLKGTDAENRAVVQSMISGFGNYTVDGDTITISWVASSYPNRVGTQEKRSYKITGDNMVATQSCGIVWWYFILVLHPRQVIPARGCRINRQVGQGR